MVSNRCGISIRHDALDAIETLAQRHALSGRLIARRAIFKDFWAAWMTGMLSLVDEWIATLYLQAPPDTLNRQYWAVSSLLPEVREQWFGRGMKHIVCVAIERVAKSMSDRTIWDGDYGDYGLALEDLKREFESAITRKIQWAGLVPPANGITKRRADSGRPIEEEPFHLDDVIGRIGFGDLQVALYARRIYHFVVPRMRRGKSAIRSGDHAALKSVYSELDSHGFKREWISTFLEGEKRKRSPSGAALDIIGIIFTEHKRSTLARYLYGTPQRSHRSKTAGR